TVHCYTLSLHDALPIYPFAEIDQARDDVADLFASRRWLRSSHGVPPLFGAAVAVRGDRSMRPRPRASEESVRSVVRVDQSCRVRSEEHTSELQSRGDLV